MAMVQAGMGLGRVVLLIGAGLAAPTVLKSGKFSDVLGELQEILREKRADGASSAADLIVQDMAQIKGMLRQLSSSNVVAVLQVDPSPSNGAASALVAPAAAVGAVSYCYMWWKGISLSSLMYVTKRNMANAVASMTKHLEHVQNSLAALSTARIQHVDNKLDQQKQICGQIKDEVTNARLKLTSIGSDMNNLKDIVMGLDEKMDSIEAKQEGLQRIVKRLGDSNNNELPGLGIRELLAIESARPSGGRTLPSAVIKSARLMLP